MIRYKVDIQEELKKRGYTTYKIKQEKLIPGQTFTKICKGELISLETLDKICIMLHCQPGDLIESVASDDEKIRFF